MGSRIAVDPIRRLKDIHAISKLLSYNPRNHQLFVMGTNNGIRTGDLLKLKVGDSDIEGLRDFGNQGREDRKEKHSGD